ncbi:MAG: hypothetical protein ACE5SW_05000 [Nitrososphaeraceae archaeon]
MINYFSLVILISFNISFFSNDKILDFISADAESPNVTIFPECGSTFDHRIFFSVNGFNPNGIVHWELVNSNDDVDLYGYFETDESGNIEEFIFVEEMEPDTYTLRFFDDRDNNFIKDFDGAEVILNYEIPCDKAIF